MKTKSREIIDNALNESLKVMITIIVSGFGVVVGVGLAIICIVVLVALLSAIFIFPLFITANLNVLYFGIVIVEIGVLAFILNLISAAIDAYKEEKIRKREASL